mmetsp:Transcript_52662/g.118145  ORF Transcript_52662/g.118145 Transcript_52662/m.118145 type:complete len:274 (+) Transcript_52662:66-887(+)
MAGMVARRLPVLLLLGSAAASEVISDLVAPEADKARALRLRADNFWQALSKVAEDMRLLQHAQLYEQVEEAVAPLGPEHQAVAEALKESLQRLRRADGAVFAQGMESSKAISEELAGPTSSRGLGWLEHAPSFLAKALESLVDGGDYERRAGDEVTQRQQALLPMLTTTAAVTADVLKETRLASARAFDVLKHDIYTPGAAKTPEPAKRAANALIEASSETRRRFTHFVTGMAQSLVTDSQSRKVGASTTVAMAELRSLEEVPASKGNLIFPL